MTIIPMARCRADACRSGEIPCPCPQECLQPDEMEGDGSLAWLGLSLLAASALVTIFAVLWVLS